MQSHLQTAHTQARGLRTARVPWVGAFAAVDSVNNLPNKPAFVHASFAQPLTIQVLENARRKLHYLIQSNQKESYDSAHH